MSSDKALFACGALFGLSSGAFQLALGAPWATIAIRVIASAGLGTVMTLAVVWVLLRIFRKQHMVNTVTNWVLIVGLAVNCLAIGLVAT